MRTSSSAALPALPPAGRADTMLPADDLAAHLGSARLFRDACISELQLSDRLSQWTEWVDGVLSRRFATSVLLVGGAAALIALLA